MPEVQNGGQSGNSPDTSNDNSTTGGDTGGFTPPATQDELNRIIDDRLKRERSKYADYKDLKAKAAKFDEIEQANQTELEKASSKTATAEKERDDARAEALRLRVAAKHGITEEDADLFLTGTDEDTLTKQAKRLTDRESERKTTHGNRVPNEGRGNRSQQPDDEREAVRTLFGAG